MCAAEALYACGNYKSIDDAYAACSDDFYDSMESDSKVVLSVEMEEIKAALDRAYEYSLDLEVYEDIFQNGLTPAEACWEWDI